MKDKILQPPTPSCLAAETIAMHVNGFLAGDELIEAEKHLKECDYCKEKVDKVKKDTKRFEQESGVAERVKSVAAIGNWVSKREGGLSNIPEELINPIRLIREDIISPIGKGVRTDERKSRRYQEHTGMIPLALEPEALEQMIRTDGFAAPKYKFLAEKEEPDDYQVEVIQLGESKCLRETYMAEVENGKRHFYVGIQNARELSDNYSMLRVVVELAEQDEPIERLIDLRGPAVASFGEINRKGIVAIEIHPLEE